MIYLNITNSYVTNARTGIQRVVRELSRRLVDADYALIAYYHGRFYLLSDDETAAFLDGEPGTPSQAFRLDAIRPGDVYFDIDGSWGDPYDTDALFQDLKARGAIIVKMHYDAVPVLHPQFSHKNTVFRYIENFSSGLKYADYWLCISNTVRRDLCALARQFGVGNLSTHVFDLGSDLPIDTSSNVRFDAGFDELLKKPFALSVGTLEPRKNYELVVDVFDEVCKRDNPRDVSFVIVGKSGWNNENLVRRIKQHPEYGKRLWWLDAADDAQLDKLYRSAKVCLCLSHYEGYGLPVVEALSRGCPVICTADSALEEVARGHAKAVRPAVEDVAKVLPEFFRRSERRRVRNYTPTSWDASAREVETFLQDVTSDKAFLAAPRQAVYISVRPEALRRSVLSLQQHVRFVREVVVLTSDAALEAMHAAVAGLALKVVVVTESRIGITELPDDHQERNTYLRNRLYHCDFIDENFIALDDDCVVLAETPLTHFIADGRHQAFFFFEDGRQWLGAYPEATSFDVGIFRTVDFLGACGYGVRLYNSHQPQIINKRLAVEIFDRLAGLKLDEWSSYFNIAKHVKPALFADRPYQAAGWPPNFESWVPSAIAEPLLFFNDFDADRELAEAPEAASGWLSQLKTALSTAERIKPQVPVLEVTAAGARFNCTELACPADRVLLVPIHAAVPLTELRLSFWKHNFSFHDESIPNFLHLPLNSVGNARDVKVSVSIRNADAKELSTAHLLIHREK
ncbi:MAG: glycosyltransferase family 4 protein [Telluria sp.]